MTERYRQLSDSVIRQNDARLPWSDQTPMDMMDKLSEEIGELRDSMTNDEDAIHVAGEIGDVLYVLIRLSHELGIDPLDALQMKTVRNGLKYNDALMHTSDVTGAKDLYQWMGGDERFFEWYERNAPEAEG